MFKTVKPQVNFPELEQEILEFWQKEHIFEKSLENRKNAPTWTFLDGPPFVTGMPHYGSLLSSLPKDVFGRYYTMKGNYVRRVWGWDGHGLPIENKVENQLEIKRKKDIEEKVGVKRFVEECKKWVNEISGEWEWYVDKIGRWVDFKRAYKTWDIPYMESTLWVFKQMYDKGHIYKGLRVSLYCPHCSTPISNFEVAMDADNYKEVKDTGTTYKYLLTGEKNTYILAWSTTPWNKIVTPALAVNPDLMYIKVKQNNEYYILAETTLKTLIGEYEIVETLSGKTLIGKKYTPHFDYYKESILEGEKAFEIIPGNFVTADEGTGVVTIAAYGEEDLKVMKELNVHIEIHLDDEGHIKENVPYFGGMYYLKANDAVDNFLKEKGLIYKQEQITHSVAHCWRCATKLYYAPQNAWYVNIQDLKPKLLETNEEVNWFPKHFKHGRYKKSVENAPDWCISRNRYWGSPVPVWECGCGEKPYVPSSIKDLEEKSGKKITELHKPEIDDITVPCICGEDMKRTPEVLDSWIEAGSASFAERHFPFSGDKLEDFYPPDFIAEYTGQIRAWFYVQHVIGCAIYGTKAFKNVLVEGVILGTDGRKMSKNFKNYPDPKEMLNKYGGDALRLYLMSTPVMHGEDIKINEEDYKQQVRGLLLTFWNIYNFYIGNALNDGYHKITSSTKSTVILDIWAINLVRKTAEEVTKSLDNFDTVTAINALQKCINELSVWYIRRSRDRVGSSAEDEEDKMNFYQTSQYILEKLCILLAPLVPFITDAIYKNITGKESVHLENWVKEEQITDVKILDEMTHVRKVIEAGHSSRKETGVKVRQPLAGVTLTSDNKQILKNYEQFILAELNVESINYKKGEGYAAEFDTKLTPELILKGEYRELMRTIQGKRKELGLSLKDGIDLVIPEKFKIFEKELKKKITIHKLEYGNELKINA